MLSTLFILGAIILIPGSILLLIMKHGTLRYSNVFLPGMLVMGAGIGTGLLFIGQTWEGGTRLLLGSCLGLVVVYGWWFFRKPTKTTLDILKLIFVVTFGLAAAAIGLSLFVGVLSYLRTLSFWALVLYFLYITYWHISDDGNSPPFKQPFN